MYLITTYATGSGYKLLLLETE